MRIGIDLGGTKIEVIALDDHGETLLRHRLPTPSGNYTDILEAIAALVDFAEQKTGRTGTVGIASPGAESLATGLIKNSNSTALNGKPLSHDIAQKLRRDVRIENDANCFTLSEAVDGAAAGFKTVFGVIIGTGVGGGIVLDKKILIGRNRIAGEWGHNPLPWAKNDEISGVTCHCGKASCIEYFLSGSGLALTYNSMTNRRITAEEVAAGAIAGDSQAMKSIEIYINRLARSLAAMINVLDPDVIVLGGGLSNITRLYSELPQLVAKYTFSDRIDTPIVRAVHGDSSGVRGAAWLWPGASAPDQISR
jgi:fructokinase